MALLGSAMARDKAQLRKQITGEIVSVDSTNDTLILKGITTRVVIFTDERTEVTVAGRKKTLAGVKVGDRAVVKYSDVDGRHVARSMIVEPAKAGKKCQNQ